uniref:uncharacterized protein LOC131103809 n=1 Tax=Doryrhamphus excisus TaxID=161450 RepID=UPI0025AE3F95|nr:uncharacterized protein LOC131103809 [Doryrhamphus excisus]
MGNIDTHSSVYIDNYLCTITKDLDVNKTRLLLCDPKETEGLKSKINVQVAVLEYLQGKRKQDINLSQMWTEIIPLREKLKASEEKEQLSDSNLLASWKIINDLRLQLHESQVKEKESAEYAEKIIQDLLAQKSNLFIKVQKMKEHLLNHAASILSTEEPENGLEKLYAVQTCMDLFDKLHEIQNIEGKTPEREESLEEILPESSEESNIDIDTPASELEQQEDASPEGTITRKSGGRDRFLKRFPFFQWLQRHYPSSTQG